MKILFVHQNFPGQYLHLARHLGAQPGFEVVFLTQRQSGELPGVRKIVYQPRRPVTPNVHLYIRETEAGVLNAQEVARAALSLKRTGFVPDVMVGHNGWGEIWYLKDVYPDTPLLGYFEFFYQATGADVGFDPLMPATVDTAPRVRTKNLGNLLGLEAVDLGQCPTEWQRSGYPVRWHSRLRVIHEGVDTRIVAPDPQARVKLPDGRELSADDEVVTYVARNLEPYRGFPSFMRSLPAILARRPWAHVVVIGGDGTSYGPRLATGSFRDLMLQELGDAPGLERVHFLGQTPYSVFLSVLQISSAHVYLTYPFVLSWSMLEAMAAGCLVVGSRTPPVEEVIRHGENGLLVDFFDPHDIAETVVAALEDPAACTSLRRSARETVIERYDLQSVCLPAQLRLLDELAGSRPRASRPFAAPGASQASSPEPHMSQIQA